LERTARLESLRKKLADAVAAEEYEAAATLRDEIRRLEAEAGKEA
jgi:protein-arginine kinase activator protein McsA